MNNVMNQIHESEKKYWWLFFITEKGKIFGTDYTPCNVEQSH